MSAIDQEGCLTMAIAKRRGLPWYWMKVGMAGLGAVAATAGARALVQPPPLTPVAVLKSSVAALRAITAADLLWVPMEHPPGNVLTQADWRGDPLAARALPGGTVLTTNDVTTAGQAVGLRAGEVRYVATITPASAVVVPGERVDVWSLPANGGSASNAGPSALALGVRVLGLYTAQGAPIGPAPSGGLLNSNATPPTPALAALAVPAYALPSLMAANPGQTVLLVQDPSQTRFALITSAAAGSGSPAVAPTPSGSTASAASPGQRPTP